MALSTEDRQQASDLLIENERRLRIRDKQIQRYGDGVAPEIVLEAEDIRRKIVALRAVLEPELPDEISGLVKRRLEDDYFVFQTTLGAKQDVAQMREDLAIVKQSQALAATWRMQADDRLSRIESRVDTSEAARRRHQPRYRALLVVLTIGLLLVFCVLAALLARGGFS